MPVPALSLMSVAAEHISLFTRSLLPCGDFGMLLVAFLLQFF